MEVTLGRRAPHPSFAALRELAAKNPLAHALIQIRRAQFAACDWDIQNTGPITWESRRQEAFRFFCRPSPHYAGYSSWFGGLAEELMITDATTILLHPAKRFGEGLFGGNTGHLRVLDGATVEPVLRPDLHIIGYHQYTTEVPRRPAFDVLTAPTPGPVAVYTCDQVVAPVMERHGSWSTFGTPPLEKACVAGGGSEPALDEALLPQAFGFPEGSTVSDLTLPPLEEDEWLKAYLDTLRTGLFDEILTMAGAPWLRWRWRFR